MDGLRKKIDSIKNLKNSFKELKWYEIIMIVIMIFIAGLAVFKAISNPASTQNPSSAHPQKTSPAGSVTTKKQRRTTAPTPISSGSPSPSHDVSSTMHRRDIAP